MNIHSNKALLNWLSGYHDSVGGAADECLQLYDELRQCEQANSRNLAQMHELLSIMSGLSPDPQTVSCAMSFVALEWGACPESIRAGLSKDVSAQLDQLLYLIELET